MQSQDRYQAAQNAVTGGFAARDQHVRELDGFNNEKTEFEGKIKTAQGELQNFQKELKKLKAEAEKGQKNAHEISRKEQQIKDKEKEISKFKGETDERGLKQVNGDIKKMEAQIAAATQNIAQNMIAAQAAGQSAGPSGQGGPGGAGGPGGGQGGSGLGAAEMAALGQALGGGAGGGSGGGDNGGGGSEGGGTEPINVEVLDPIEPFEFKGIDPSQIVGRSALQATSENFLQTLEPSAAPEVVTPTIDPNQFAALSGDLGAVEASAAVENSFADSGNFTGVTVDSGDVLGPGRNLSVPNALSRELASGQAFGAVEAQHPGSEALIAAARGAGGQARGVKEIGGATSSSEELEAIRAKTIRSYGKSGAASGAAGGGDPEGEGGLDLGSLFGGGAAQSLSTSLGRSSLPASLRSVINKKERLIYGSTRDKRFRNYTTKSQKKGAPTLGRGARYQTKRGSY